MVAAGSVLHRRAGRVLLLDPGERVLLLRGSDPGRPEAGAWWFTVGGGCLAGESTTDAARREAAEEAGVLLPPDLGPVVLHRRASFEFEGLAYEQEEDYFLARVPTDAVSTDGWTDDERRVLSGLRWWSVAELVATAEVIHPAGLAELLEGLLRRDGDAI